MNASTVDVLQPHQPQSLALSRFLRPTRLKPLQRVLGARDRVEFLDIGCATRSAQKTKMWLRHAVYTGVDITEGVLTDTDRALIDRFVLVSENDTTYAALPDSHFDVLMMSHVLEHMRDPVASVRSLAGKVKPGGYVVMAFPSRKSLSLPSGKGTLQFCDDASHVSIIDFVVMSQVLLDEGFEVLRAGPSRDTPRLLLGLLLYPFAQLRRLLTGRLDARGLWYVYGFEDMVFARKRERGPAKS
jgi:SAM-dependent methyltransferase